ncbi:hypothetical protein HNR23_004752 [Nocardiopsis mwathae]|uniref:Uncharacterized protein n=1 Tax=Nocardiopsis mwathae TaxID=1472723 RepID=A0A7X0D7I9_9ACTN|nr:hypothetical protein [Nocardiopsis mwathae]MBB6174692.1 hypothetical protein [Nocardiopsis mwathae]
MLARSLVAAPGSGQGAGEAGWLLNLMLLLVLLYVQIRIPFWVLRLVWAPNPGTSPIAGMLKQIAWIMAFRSM